MGSEPEEHTPAFLRPRLRIFISADIVGSTSLKQARVDADKKDQGAWANIAQSFYIIAERELLLEWRKIGHISSAPSVHCGSEPRLWKVIGDEIVFVKEVTNSIQVCVLIECWLRALNALRGYVRKGRRHLDVKCTAWIAGFPFVNKEIIVRGWGDNLPSEIREYFQDCGKKLERFHKGDKSIEVDYLGPSIDAGFRLSSHATSRKFVISLDLAYILSLASAVPDLRIQPRSMQYLGSFPLKGVLRDRPYPVFWLDTGCDPLALLEDKLTSANKRDTGDIKAFCDGFYVEHEDDHVFPPFIDNGGEQYLRRKPPGYDEAIAKFMANYFNEDVMDEPPDQPANTLAAVDQESAIAGVLDAASETIDANPKTGG